MRERVARVVAASLVPASVVTRVWQLFLGASAHGSGMSLWLATRSP